VYVSNEGASSISAFGVDQTTGALLATVTGSPFSAGTTPQPVTLHPSKPFAYVANAGSANLSAYSVNPSTGVFTPIANPATPGIDFFNAGTAPQQVTIDSTGKFAIVANSGSDNVSVYEINQSTGELAEVAGSPFLAGDLPRRVTVDPTGKFVFVPNSGSSNVSVYRLNATTGFLSPVTGSPFPAGTGPRSATTAGTF
jgi:6-phosphogluconolactonase (cycloisomerase 2 family)